MYELVASVRVEPTAKVLVRFEGLPGEFSQHDIGQVDVKYVDGSRERIHFFASRLKYSRWSEVRIVPDERVESLVRALLSSFESFGGVPMVGVFDNPKTIVVSRAKSRIEWNTTFGQVALDYRFAPELCAPRRANQKGSVENLVGWVKGSFQLRAYHGDDRPGVPGQEGRSNPQSVPSANRDPVATREPQQLEPHGDGLVRAPLIERCPGGGGLVSPRLCSCVRRRRESASDRMRVESSALLKGGLADALFSSLLICCARPGCGGAAERPGGPGPR